jgi:hypothetical protein
MSKLFRATKSEVSKPKPKPFDPKKEKSDKQCVRRVHQVSPGAPGLAFETGDRRAHHVKNLTLELLSRGHRESMSAMGYVSRAYEKLPGWVKMILGMFALAGIVYGVAHDGWTFLLKVIFSPVP